MHDMEKPPLDELAHYGVKGMKWGERKAKAKAGAKTAASKTKSGIVATAKAANKAGESAADAYVNYQRNKDEMWFKGAFLGGVFGTPQDRLRYQTMVASEKVLMSAGNAAIKKINTEVSVAQMRRSMRNL